MYFERINVMDFICSTTVVLVGHSIQKIINQLFDVGRRAVCLCVC